MDNPIDVAEVIRENEVLRARVAELERTARNVAMVENNYRLDEKAWEDKEKEYVKALRMNNAFAELAYNVFDCLSLGVLVDIKAVQQGKLVSVLADQYSSMRIVGCKTRKSLFIGVSYGGCMEVFEYEEWSKWKDVRLVIVP